MFTKNILVSFTLYKSSLVQQGRNLIVSEFLNEGDKYTHLLFIDSDIDFQAKSIFKMLEKDKDIIAVPYPMKYIDWPKIKRRMDTFKLTDIKEIAKAGFHYPIKVEGMNEVIVEDGVAEVTHAPTGCMLIKRDVLEKMIKKYPELEIHQPTLVNGKEDYKKNFFLIYLNVYMTQILNSIMAKTLVSVKDGQLWVVKYTYIVWIIYLTQENMSIVADIGMNLRLLKRP